MHLPQMNKEIVEMNNCLDEYTFEKKIGEGQHSVVRLASSAGEKYAIKVINKERIRSVDGLLRLEKEINALVCLNPHPNIVNFKQALHGESCLYLVMEYLPMDMFTFMDNFKAGTYINKMHILFHVLFIKLIFKLISFSKLVLISFSKLLRYGR